MAYAPETTAPADQVDHIIGERIGTLNSGGQCDEQIGLDSQSKKSGLAACALGSVSGFFDSGETDEIAESYEDGHEEEPEITVPKPASDKKTSYKNEFAELAALEREVLGAAAGQSKNFDDIYWDGKSFFMKTKEGYWRPEGAAMVTSELKVRGFAESKPQGAAFSPMDKAKVTIRKERSVDGAAPRLYHKGDTYLENGQVYLNTARVTLYPAAETAGGWGEYFPRYAAVLDNVFSDLGERAVFLAWFKRFYESAEAGDLALGQVMALVGPVHCFKSFIIEKLIAAAMGGSSDASDMASGENSSFTSDVFHTPLAVIDDSRGATSEAMRSKYTATIKKLAATGRQPFHEKFQSKVMVQWKGRVVLGLNDDPNSMRVIPDLDKSNEDKIIAILMKQWPGQLPPEAFNTIVEDELGHFLAWIKAWDIPSILLDTSNRYGIKSYISPIVRGEAMANSNDGRIRNLLEDWWTLLGSHEQRVPWVGTAQNLMRQFEDNYKGQSIKDITTRTLGLALTRLSAIKDSGVHIAQAPTAGRRNVAKKFSIFLPETEQNPPVVTHVRTDKS